MILWLSSVCRGLVVQRLIALFDCSWAVWRGFESEDSGFSYLRGVCEACARGSSLASLRAGVTVVSLPRRLACDRVLFAETPAGSFLSLIHI